MAQWLTNPTGKHEPGSRELIPRVLRRRKCSRDRKCTVCSGWQRSALASTWFSTGSSIWWEDVIDFIYIHIQLVLISHRFHIREFTYSLKMYLSPQVRAWGAFAHMWTHTEKRKIHLPTNAFPAKAEQSETLPSCFHSYCKQMPLLWSI